MQQLAIEIDRYERASFEIIDKPLFVQMNGINARIRGPLLPDVHVATAASTTEKFAMECNIAKSRSSLIIVTKPTPTPFRPYSY